MNDAARKDGTQEINRLLQRWKTGEEAALHQLVDQVEPLVRRMARRRMGDHLRDRIDSADVTQEVLLGFLRSAPDFTTTLSRS